MNVRPLIIRELRAEARRPGNYWVRTLAAGLLTALFVWSVWNFQGHPNTLGLALFQALSQGLTLAILVIVSALTGDCISREKREGTLGLLFLTPLNAREIVVGKTLLHTVRAGTIFLTVLPILGLPFLLGGIPIVDAVQVSFGLAATLCLAVAGGIIASVYTVEWVQSIVWAELICVGFLLTSLLFQNVAFVFLRLLSRIFGVAPLPFLIVGLLLPALFGLIILLLALRHAGRVLQKRWQVESNARAEPFWVRLFSESDFWRLAFHWNARKARDKNPIAWLQEYNWTSRLTKWGWCILLFVLQMRMLLQFRRYIDYQMQLYVLTALGIAFSAAASFRRERQTGALELLLVTPISARKLIWGRLQGVWFHFLPAMAIITCVWIMGPQWISLPARYLFYLAGAYFCIPVIGFYCSLLSSNVLVAWLLTVFFSLLLPYGIIQGFYWDIGRFNIPIVVFAIQLIEGIAAAWLLHENLTRRRFAL